MRYRVDELAARCGISVDTVRYYQTKGLLPPPVREGRIAWYSDDHLARLRRIRALKGAGFTLGSIRRLLAGELDPPDAALVEALASTLPGDGGELSLAELAEATGVSPALLAAIEREGLLSPRRADGEGRYTAADVAAVKAGLALLEAGLPLSELLALARVHDDAMTKIAERAVDLFVDFVRDPIRAAARDDAEAAERLVAAFRAMLPATTALVSHHFQRKLFQAALERLERIGSDDEVAAIRRDER